MKRKAWLVVSLLMAAVMVLSSCASEETGTTGAQTVTGQVVGGDQTTTGTTTTTDTGETVVTPTDEEPKYGGTLKILSTGDPQGWDPALSQMGLTVWARPVCSILVTHDWWKGPAGTNEWSFADINGRPPDEILKGDLAESWEIPSDTSVIYHLRQGIMWQDKPGVMSAREVTADDIVWNWERFTSTPTHDYGTPGRDNPITSIVAIDRYTVEFTWEEPNYARPVETIGTIWFMIPPEVVEQYGDMTDWRHVTGSGPFALTDYVSGSSISYERNPNWHFKDPEGRSMPYLDGIQVLVIPEVTTQVTAMRSGQLDFVHAWNSFAWEDAESLIETNPELLYKKQIVSSVLQVKFDMKAPPFGPNGDEDARKVRRAAHMAIDYQGLAEDYYQGNAEIVPTTMPSSYGIEALKIENLTESSRELFEYNPEKAKELLAEAGYPNGIKITFTVGYDAEEFQLIKAFWDDVGIETELNVVDYGALTGIVWGGTMEDATMHWWGLYFDTGWPYYSNEDGSSHQLNVSGVQDDEINRLVDAVNESMDTAERWELATELHLRIIDQCWEAQMPVEYKYNFWQPWLKGYHGENTLAYAGPIDLIPYLWLDKD